MDEKERRVGELERALKELYVAFCSRDDGHKDDFTHEGWLRWEKAIKACVSLGEKLPEPESLKEK